jgi:hypothetical protein
MLLLLGVGLLVTSVVADENAAEASGVSPVDSQLATENAIGEDEEYEIEYEDHPRITLAELGKHLPVNSVENLSTKEFFDDYVSKKRILLIRRAFTEAPAFVSWSDEYLGEMASENANYSVTVERRAKENREEDLISIRFSDMMKNYRSYEYHMFDEVPSFLRKDVLLPQVLQCEQAPHSLEETIMSLSWVNVTSVVHLEDFEKLVCVVDGHFNYILIDYYKYKDIAYVSVDSV